MFKKQKKFNFWSLLTNLLLVLLLGGIGGQFWAKTSLASQQATVIKVIDGDTVDVKMSGCRLPLNGNPQTCRVQLACIDTPEVNDQPFFQQSKDRLMGLLPAGTAITVRDTGSSFKERIVGEIFTNNQSVNLQLVREGQAVILCRYLNNNCAGSRNSYISAQNAAKQEGLGVWNRQQPWGKAKTCAG